MAAEQPEWNPNHVDLSKPNAARMYDWYLGGAHNFDVDREFGRKVVGLWPGVIGVARSNRAFMQRMVRDAVAAGVRQFLDIGSGVPTVGNVHEIALSASPDARVVYVDYEPVAFQTGQLLLAQQEVTERATIVQQDLRRPEAILDHPETRRLLDFDQPIFLLMVALLHFIAPEDDPAGLIAAYRDRLPPGSRLGLSHIACDEADAEQAGQVRAFCEAYQQTSNPLYLRDRAEINALFDGWSLLDPGVVFLPDWRPEHPVSDDPFRALAWCGVGELPR